LCLNTAPEELPILAIQMSLCVRRNGSGMFGARL
jgi:hypothetical protein